MAKWHRRTAPTCPNVFTPDLGEIFMKLHIDEDHLAMSRRAAHALAQAITAKPDLNIVVATGSTPMTMYEEVATMQRAGTVDCRRLNVFQLDAYLDVADDDDRSLYGWMKRSFLDPLEIPDAQVVRIDAGNADPEAACRAFADTVRAHGGFDIAVLGLGPNGHLGFNEPPSPRDAPTRVVRLSEESLVSNARYWGGRDRVPPLSVTAGMDLLLGAKTLMLLVSGATKRNILHRTLTGPIDPMVPSSYVQDMPNSIVFADAAAAGKAHPYG
jgi:glucosamine-6-phosphate deaminase